MPEKRKEDLYDYPNNPSIINPKYPLQSILTEAHMQNTLTSDMVSVTRAEGKIPIGDPNNDYKIRLDWLGLSEDATYTVDASESQKGVVKLASTNDVDTGTDHTKAVTPKGLKWGIDNAFQNNVASTEQPGTVKLTNTIISNENTTGYKTYAVTSKAVKDYITDNFAADIVNFGDYNNDIKPIISASNSSKYDVLATKPSYSKKSVNAYTLHRYLSDNDLYFNVSNQSIGGIIFRDRTESESVSTVEKARLYVDKSSGNLTFKVAPNKGIYFYQTDLNSNTLTGSNNKTLTLLDSNGATSFPGTVTVGDFVYKSTSTTVGSTTKPIYIKNGKIAECSTIDNVNNAENATNATTASKLGSSDIGSSAKPIYLAKGVATASNSSIGNANTPVYMNAGTITSTGKSFANYLPLAGGTLTGKVNFPNNTLNTFGDDIDVGDGNVAGHLVIQGKNGNTGIVFRKYNDLNTTAQITFNGSSFDINRTINGTLNGNASSANSAGTITSTLPISKGGTGATARTAAVKALFNEGVEGNATHLLGITSDWSKCGYVYKDSLKSILGLGNYLPLSGGSMSGEIYRKDTGATKGTKPSSNRWKLSYMFTDKNNVLYGGMENGYLTDRTNRVNMIVYPGTTTNTNTNAQIGVGFDSNGNWFTYAPTPASGDNSTKIATTEFVKTYVSSSSAKTDLGIPNGALPMPSTTSTAIGYIFTGYGRYHTLPSGGTWFWWACCFNANSTSIGPKWGISAGGKEIDLEYDNRRAHFFAMRIKT